MKLLPPPNDYFAGDLHLGHALMIRPVDEGGEGRPFATLEEMTETFVRNLGAGGSQKSNDVLWLTGDVCWYKPRYKPLLTPFMEAIRPHWGKINLIIGNHDYYHTRKKVDLFDEIHDGIVLERLGKCIHVTHYPMESWCKSNHGSIHLHAHSHGSSRTIPRRLDTGIMKQNWQAIQLQALLTIIDHRDSTIQSQNSNPVHPCSSGHSFVRIITKGNDMEAQVVRWCDQCGAVVIDTDYDYRTNPGAIMTLRYPKLKTLT